MTTICHDDPMDPETTDAPEKTGMTTERNNGFEDGTCVTFIEFYAGIGGWSMALTQALQRCSPNKHLARLAALDHSDLCLKVLEHNCPSKERRAVSIERLTLSQVQEWNASIWAMSPPCQPHTRQHKNQQHDLDDPRSRSFLHLCNLLEQMEDSKLPRLLLMENVVGFESSNSCQRWRRVLFRRRYKVAHFHLNPTQVNIPNDRPRYYSVAVLSRGNVKKESDSLSTYLSSETDLHILPIIHESIPELDVVPLDSVTCIAPISEFLDDDIVDRDSLRIPDKLLASSAAWCFDIVTPKDRRSACFTQSYGKFIRGTGSVLWESPANDSSVSNRFALLPPEEREFNPDWAEGLNLKENMRFFSGTEVSRLMGFDESFSFPADCSLKQQWKLLGNSLNVRLASRIAQLGILQKFS